MSQVWDESRFYWLSGAYVIGRIRFLLNLSLEFAFTVSHFFNTVTVTEKGAEELCFNHCGLKSPFEITSYVTCCHIFT